MKETTDHIDNIIDIVHACRKINPKIGARLKHFYLNPEMILVQLSGNAQLSVPSLIAENGVSQLTKEGINKIFNQKIS
jgi:hypothetical protein